MTPTQRIFALTAAVLIFVFIIDLVRRRKIGIQYSILWLFMGVVIFIVATWYDSLLIVTSLIGAVVPTTTLFIFGILFLMVMTLHLTMRITQQQITIVQLAQEIALLKHELERDEDAPGSGA